MVNSVRYNTHFTNSYNPNRHKRLDDLPKSEFELSQRVKDKTTEIMGKYQANIDYFKDKLGQAMISGKVIAINDKIRALAEAGVKVDLIGVLSGMQRSINESSQRDLKSILDLLRKSFFVPVFFCLFFGRAFVFF